MMNKTNTMKDSHGIKKGKITGGGVRKWRGKLDTKGTIDGEYYDKAV